MNLEEKTSFYVKDGGIHLETEGIIKKGKEKNHYKIHTYEVSRNKISTHYAIEAYENNKFLGKRVGYGGFNQTEKDKLMRALDAHFNCIVKYLRKGEVDKFREFFTKLPESSTLIVSGSNQKITKVK